MQTAAFLKDQLTKPSGDSKKWRMTIIGLWGNVIIFGAAVALFVFRPALAGQMTVLVQVVITSFSGIVALYLGTQGAVDYKATAILQHLPDAPVPNEQN